MPAGLGGNESRAADTDPLEAREKGGFLTPLGGTPDGRAATRATDWRRWSTFSNGRAVGRDDGDGPRAHQEAGARWISGISSWRWIPGMFRDPADFRADVHIASAMRCARPADRSRSCPCWWPATRNGATPRAAHAGGYSRWGRLLAQLRDIAGKSGAAWVMG